METLETCSDHVITNIIDPQQRIAIGLTRRFPVTSRRGNKNLIILYNYDSNCILVLPMKNRTKKS